MNADRKLAWDWFAGTVPANVVLEDTAYLETTYSFQLFRSRAPEAVRLGRGASIYLGVMFDLGAAARVRVGDFTLMNGSRIICDAAIDIGDYCLISWNTVLMDTYRVPVKPALRQSVLEQTAQRSPRRIEADVPACPIRIGNAVWVGFDSVVLPGVTIGDGVIVGARSVVTQDVPPFAVVAGNPARVLRQLDPEESRQAVATAIQGIHPLPLATMSPSPKGKIIVFGILFFYPLAGVTYQFLHYLIGLRRLGYDPYYVEDSARWIYDPRLNDMAPDPAGNIAMVLPALKAHGFGDRWCFRGCYEGGGCHGLSETQLAQLYREAEAFFNVTGAQEIRDEHREIKRRIYVESDPFVAQVKVANGDPGMIELLAAHDTHFSFGENLGASDCDTPIEQFRWLPTRQPVATELWSDGLGLGGPTYTTITTWHNKGKDIEWRGEKWFWTKDREFERFLELPRLRPQPRFELATSVGDDVRQLLLKHGWSQTGSIEVSCDADAYKRYIQHSRGEFTVARDQYVRPNTGWFSDRSCCYLAAGRPVITQETGFSKFLPSGKGLLGFRTMEDVLRAVDAVESDYAGHCRAARDLAAEYFAAEKVVGSLMQRAGL